VSDQPKKPRKPGQHRQVRAFELALFEIAQRHRTRQIVVIAVCFCVAIVCICYTIVAISNASWQKVAALGICAMLPTGGLLALRRRIWKRIELAVFTRLPTKPKDEP
jgi:hypothetical protein